MGVGGGDQPPFLAITEGIVIRKEAKKGQKWVKKGSKTTKNGQKGVKNGHFSCFFNKNGFFRHFRPFFQSRSLPVSPKTRFY